LGFIGLLGKKDISVLVSQSIMEEREMDGSPFSLGVVSWSCDSL